VRYSGSPLPLSFSEIEYPHQVVVLEIEGEAVKSIDKLLVPRAVDLLRVPSRPAPLSEVLAQLHQWTAVEPDLPEERWPYLEVRVLFDAPEPGARAEIESALVGKPVRLAGIDVTYTRGERAADDDSATMLGDLSQLQPEDVLKRHYQKQYGSAVPSDLLQAFQTLLLETEGEA
jgi:exonuclease SbcD